MKTICKAIERNLVLLFAVVILSAPLTAIAQFSYGTNADGRSITITGYNGSGGDVTIPSMINGFPVTTIGLYAFCDCTNLANIVIPSSVTSIEEGAFSSCAGLHKMLIPDSVTNIGAYAFGDCSGLVDITIPGSTPLSGPTSFTAALACSISQFLTVSPALGKAPLPTAPA